MLLRIVLMIILLSSTPQLLKVQTLFGYSSLKFRDRYGWQFMLLSIYQVVFRRNTIINISNKSFMYSICRNFIDIIAHCASRLLRILICTSTSILVLQLATLISHMFYKKRLSCLSMEYMGNKWVMGLLLLARMPHNISFDEAKESGILSQEQTLRKCCSLGTFLVRNRHTAPQQRKYTKGKKKRKKGMIHSISWSMSNRGHFLLN